MGSEILVNINVNSASQCPASWGNIDDMSIGSITVQDTDSVLILMFQAQIVPATDNTAEFRFYVNGSSTGSPNIVAFSDNPIWEEANSVTMVWAITGLSGSSNSFSIQWQRVQSTSNMDESRNRTFQILEITSGDAEILVNQSASNSVPDPATWEDLFTANSITVAGTSSILIMIANVPWNMELSQSVDFQFAVDGTKEGAITSVCTDANFEGNGWSGVHVLDSLSPGTHSFHLEWQTITGAGDTDTRLRTFQVVEITSLASLKLELESSAPGSAPGSYGDVNGLSDAYTVDGVEAIALIFANIQITAASDRNADFMIGVDGTEEGAELISFTDNANFPQRILLARAKTGLSNASHTFAARWKDIRATPTLDEGKPRTLFVIEFTQTPPVTYKLDGITKNNAGSVLGSCHCFLIKDNLDDTYDLIEYQLSNAGTGAYSFTGLEDNDANYQVISWKDDGTHVFDVTDHVLTPVEE